MTHLLESLKDIQRCTYLLESARTEMQVRADGALLRADAVFHACVLRVLACA